MTAFCCQRCAGLLQLGHPGHLSHLSHFLVHMVLPREWHGKAGLVCRVGSIPGNDKAYTVRKFDQIEGRRGKGKGKVMGRVCNQRGQNGSKGGIRLQRQLLTKVKTDNGNQIRKISGTFAFSASCLLAAQKCSLSQTRCALRGANSEWTG